MLDWIEGYVKRWAGYVASPVIDLAHWALHALASVVYTVFGHVGDAWKIFFDAVDWARRSADEYVREVYRWIYTIIRTDLPLIWGWVIARAKLLASEASKLYNLGLAYALSLYRKAIQAVDNGLVWVTTHVYDPLKARADQLESDLLKWGYVAWDYVTHPDKLAPLLVTALITAAEAVFWDIAAPIAKFAFGIILKDAKRFVQLIETILTAVL